MWRVFNVIQGNSVGIKRVKRSNCAKYCNNHSTYFIGLAKKLILLKFSLTWKSHIKATNNQTNTNDFQCSI